MPHPVHPIFAREGWVHIALTFILAGVVQYFGGGIVAAPFWVFAIFTLQFFRDPRRNITSAPGGVVCPADGRVISIGEAQDPYLKRPAKRISIFMNAFNVHSNRSPVSGRVRERWYHAGKFFNAALDKSSAENERNALWIMTDDGEDVVVVQVAGLIARRILCYVPPGAAIVQGERYGFIRFGSRVDVYLAPHARVVVALGAKVTGGVDVIAEFPQS